MKNSRETHPPLKNPQKRVFKATYPAVKNEYRFIISQNFKEEYKMKNENHSKLKDLKESPKDSYEDVIERLLKKGE